MRYKVIIWVLDEHETVFLDIVQSTLVYVAKLETGFVAFLPYWDRRQQILLKNYHGNQLQLSPLSKLPLYNKTHILNKHIVIFKV